ncbi:porin [Chelativorans sp. Marseille-P2723]|uniref:porin n=1 Tax=Chelativorans sp. Marseille-P2723 TaxID=2709133 RepID=UPI00156F38DD|nr:porin [Chelativorans sp. Marseille-P2723]
MNIKSLLVGSAIATMGVSAAQAADAIVIPEPEPMEYVRVCDVYGAGFFYIPGTETCLRVGGYVRHDIGIGFRGHQDVLDVDEFLDGDFDLNDTYYQRTRAQLNVDARSETEMGTLRAYMAMNFQATTSEFGVDVDGDDVIDGVGVGTVEQMDLNHAYIELGGLRVGYTDSWFSTFTGYAGPVIGDDFVGFGPYNTHMISYRFDGGNGFTAVVSLEDLGGLDSYLPHVVAGVGFTQGWGGVRVVGAYDSVFEEWAIKGRLDVAMTPDIGLFVMGGWSSDPNQYATWGGDWAVWGGGSLRLTETLTFNAQLSYDDLETFAAVANVAWQPVPGLTITPEIAYIDADGEDDWGGFLRFQRNF